MPRTTCQECGSRFTPGDWPTSDSTCKSCFKELEPDWYLEYIRLKVEFTGHRHD